MALAFAAQSVRAQTYGNDNLPENVLTLSIDGIPLDGTNTPTITNPQPTISGTLSQPGDSITIRITSVEQTFVATAGVNGAFNVTVPNPLDNGQHTLYIDDQLVGTFIVAAVQAPTPTPTATATATATAPSTATATASPSVVPGAPNTGAGTSNSSGQWSLAGAGVVGLAVASAVIAMWALRRRPTDA